jgi:hypothetical protein
MNDNVVSPIGYDRWPRYGPVGHHALPLVSVRCAVGFIESQPVFDCVVCVRNGLVVIGIDVVLPPTLAGRRAVLTSFRQACSTPD